MMVGSLRARGKIVTPFCPKGPGAVEPLLAAISPQEWLFEGQKKDEPITTIHPANVYAAEACPYHQTGSIHT